MPTPQFLESTIEQQAAALRQWAADPKTHRSYYRCLAAVFDTDRARWRLLLDVARPFFRS